MDAPAMHFPPYGFNTYGHYLQSIITAKQPSHKRIKKDHLCIGFKCPEALMIRKVGRLSSQKLITIIKVRIIEVLVCVQKLN